MTTAGAELVADILANPDDDAPRLVWADRIGGERGELVVIQCDLARGDLAPADHLARRRREQALLAQHGIAWAGEISYLARAWQYRRGFVEAVLVDDIVDLADHPLISSVTLRPREPIADLTPLLAPQLRALAVPASLMASTPREAWATARLTALAITGTASFPALHELCTRLPLAQLRLRDHALDTTDLQTLLRAMPALVALSLDPLPHVEAIDELRLRAFATRGAIGRLPSGARLAYLAGQITVDALRRPELTGALRTLDLRGAIDGVIGELVDDPAFLPALATLRGDTIGAPLPATLRPLSIELAIADRPGTLALGQTTELLHHDPRSIGVAGFACYPAMPDFFVEIGGQTYAFVAHRADEPVTIGGREGVSIPLVQAAPWAEQAIAIRYRDGAFVVRNHGPRMDGVRVDGRLVTEAPLTDGARLLLGEISIMFRRTR